MPDPPRTPKRQPQLELHAPPPKAAGYAELHCKTNFSFLQGASHPDELVARAAALGYAALAVTDWHSLAGVVRAHGAAKQAGLKLLIGAEIAPSDAPPLVLWAIDRAGYGRLSRLLTVGRRRAAKGDCQLTFDDVAEHAEGLLAGVLLNEEVMAAARQRREKPRVPGPKAKPSPRGSPVGATLRLGPGTRAVNRLKAELRTVARYRELFGDRCYALAELHCGPRDEELLSEWLTLSRDSGVPLVAAGDVHYHCRARLPLQNLLTAVRHGCTVAEAGERLFPNAERCLRSADELAERFAAAPELLARSLEVAARCSFSLDELRYEYPEELAPAGETPLAYLRRMTWLGANKRYPQGVPAKVRGMVEHELVLIEELHYEAYFLTVFDLVRFARRRDILCQGRGSAANSAVCYCLGVTSVDPDQMDLLFERFVSRERQEAPDIDVDFEHQRREEVLQYLYDKYGRERAGMTAEVICYRPRSAVRDVGKALGLSLDRVDRLAKSLEGYHAEPNLAKRLTNAGLNPGSRLSRQLVALTQELVGFPRHLGQHVGGMVMTQGPLCELAPIENAAMEDRTVIQWDKNDLDELGILKVDCLALGMLSAIRRCFDMVDRQREDQAKLLDVPPPERLTLANVPREDSATYDMICQADTMGVFQIESRAQMSMLPRLRPRCYYDLVIEVALVRPGPIQGNMVHPYLRRRAGEEEVTFPNEEIRDVLKRTLGVPLFQEQAMRLAVVAAGFTPGEADQLRRAMGAWRRTGVIEQFRQKLLTGMHERGLSQEFAESVFRQIKGFGEYGFPESHAASFALLVYVSAWLKRHYPAAFAASLVNSQPMGFYAPAQLVRNAREHGVEVRPTDINASQWDCSLEYDGEPLAPALRLGFRVLLGISEAQVERVLTARAEGPFTSLAQFARRTKLGRAATSKLAEADCFGSLGQNRRAALWHALALEPRERALPLLDSLPAEDDALAPLPEMSPPEEVLADYQTAGLSLRAHPMSFAREEMNALGVTPAEGLQRLRDGRRVRTAGLVLVRQRPGTAKGITFVTLEDETGTVNLIVRQEIWQRYYEAARIAAALLAYGQLQRKDEVTHVLVSKLEDLSHHLPGIKSQSRDFH